MKTIYSLVTKPINQNIGVIRISGPHAFESIKNFVPNFIPEKNKVEFHKLKNKDGFIDDALILSFVSPNSFTGEDIIEIQSHGSMFVIQKIISELNKFGLEQSKPGEFLKQAYMNGKIDLSQIEAINTLITSENMDLSNKSVENMNGKQSFFILESLDNLGKIVSNIQVSIDYPENTDLPEYSLNSIKNSINLYKKKIEKIIEDSSRLIKYSKGITISLVGIPNAGKSTLLNSFLKENRSIVSDKEGTTRDIIESIIYVDGIKITLQDTAGIKNETNDPIEQEGIKRSINSINNSDIIIHLLDGTKNLNKQKKLFKYLLDNKRNKLIEVISKSDLITNSGLTISAINNTIEPLLNKI
ncbi:MAG: tRNA uridine-5-carboxymethylaminomethyl(34) synthesis GTPase MnmE, partial [Mycoplasmataceae bacterium]|nr:tRNA uridine-5-carboxymethylaminomethyl(34) synthesis GTPase MnmE [Mycoplasmataceae bacterium]